MKKDFFLAVATMVGFVVGAGILSLPYAFSKAGFVTGAINVVLLGVVVMIMNLMIGETSLRTKTNHQLVGYTGKYMGHKWKKIMLIFITLEWYGAMIAYIIEIGKFLSALLEPILHIDPIFFSILFTLIGTYLVFRGLKIIERSEFWMVLLMIIVVAAIGIACSSPMNIDNIKGFDFKQFLLPFGVVLFAFGGAGAIPEMREELIGQAKLLKPAIIVGTLIPAIIYILFPLFVVGVTGANTTESAMIGIGEVLGYKMLLLGALFGILNMSTSFLAVGLAIKEIFKFDYGKTNLRSSLLACAFPFIGALIIIISRVDNAFYRVIDINGAVLYPLTGIVFLLTYLQAKKKGDRKPEYSLRFGKALAIIIIFVLIIGLVNKLINLF